MHETGEKHVIFRVYIQIWYVALIYLIANDSRLLLKHKSLKF